MSAPWFILPGTYVAFSECRLVWAHTRRSFASMQSLFETRPPWWFMYDTTDLLFECTSTWCPHMSGRKNWQAFPEGSHVELNRRGSLRLLSSALISESITVPRNEICWLGNIMLLAKLNLSPRQSKWLRRRVLCYVETASDWARMSQSSR